MALSYVFLQAHETLGNKIFEPAMSYDGRELVAVILEGLQRGLQAGRKNPLLEQFARDFQAVLYEDAVLGWDNRKLCSKVRTSLQKTKLPEMVAVAQLAPLYNRTWDIPVSVAGQFRFSRSASHTAVYEHLTRNWLLDDFSRTDLIKIVEIAKTFAAETIRETCDKLTTPEQRHVSYLYKVLKNEGRNQEVRNEQTNKAMEQSNQTLKQLFDIYNSPRKVDAKRDPSWSEDVKITRIMEGTD